MLANNIKAIVAHVIITFITLIYFTWCNKVNDWPNYYLVGVSASLVYILCGFLLMNYKVAYKFLSVIAVMVILEIVTIACLLSGILEAFQYVIILNPVYGEIWSEIGIEPLVGAVIPAIIPSLFLYIGLLLRRFYYRQFRKSL